ncbi:hypothetical protein EVAR_81553_1 [Eumeta japonica]|uniref:Uncharacterized protein n=1 Tax=Eumeta variegata TaxID=151549 RepID=A0A4C1V0L8_EUMVA|nr:hypothetical protein EVAR_81553_1 [Eumeta japonica]
MFTHKKVDLRFTNNMPTDKTEHGQARLTGNGVSKHSGQGGPTHIRNNSSPTLLVNIVKNLTIAYNIASRAPRMGGRVSIASRQWHRTGR